MTESDTDPGVWDKMDDIEFELCCSSREASVSCVPFQNPDVAAMMRRVREARIELQQLEGRRPGI